MRIKADGSWHYNGSKIERMPLVRLFSTILRKDPDEFVLVTPVERVAITVDDAPFLAVEMERSTDDERPVIAIRTNVSDIVEISREHPIVFETGADGGLKPYIHIRGGLWALASRALTHELLSHADYETPVELDIVVSERTSSADDQARLRVPLSTTETLFGLRSAGAFFPIARETDLSDAAP